MRYKNCSQNQTDEKVASSYLLLLEPSLISPTDTVELQDLRCFGAHTLLQEAVVFAFNSDKRAHVFEARSKIAAKREKNELLVLLLCSYYMSDAAVYL